MYVTLHHLKILRAISQTGGVAKAAEVLNTTQSALSHQIANLETQAGVQLFVRRTKPLLLSAAGVKMLKAAERILPEIDFLEQEFQALRAGRGGRLHIAIQCHACFDWLLPVLKLFRHAWPEVDIDIRAALAFDSFPALLREEVDLVITSNPESLSGLELAPLFDYYPMFVASVQNALSDKEYVVAEDFRDQTLITYPVGRDKLDVFTELLTPARVEPMSHRQVELTAVILMLVAANRGVSVLPDWVIRNIGSDVDYAVLPLGEQAVTKRLYAVVREEDAQKSYIAHFQRLVRSEAVKIQRGQVL